MATLIRTKSGWRTFATTFVDPRTGHVRYEGSVLSDVAIQHGISIVFDETPQEFLAALDPAARSGPFRLGVNLLRLTMERHGSWKCEATVAIG